MQRGGCAGVEWVAARCLVGELDNRRCRPWSPFCPPPPPPVVADRQPASAAHFRWGGHRSLLLLPQPAPLHSTRVSRPCIEKREGARCWGWGGAAECGRPRNAGVTPRDQAASLERMILWRCCLSR